MEHSPLLLFCLGMQFQTRINSNARTPLAPSIKVYTLAQSRNSPEAVGLKIHGQEREGGKNENVNSLEPTLPGYTDKHIGLHLVKGKA